MKKQDFQFDHFKFIEHDEHPKEIEKIRIRYRDSGILELLTELDHMENEPNTNPSFQEMKLTTIKRLIAIKLDLFDNDHADYLIDTLPGHIEVNERNLQKLKTAYNEHRHDNDKSFSSLATSRLK